MPFLDGYQASKKIRDLLPPDEYNIKILAITGHVENEYV
jgi:CheY-like chemotaxis protein